MLPPGLPEEEGVRLAIELGEKFHLDRNAQSRFKELLIEFFNSKPSKGISLKDTFNLGFEGAKQIAKDVLTRMEVK
jgi:hypothetical protein